MLTYDKKLRHNCIKSVMLLYNVVISIHIDWS